MDGTYLRFAGLSQASGYQSNWVELLIQEWQHCKYTKFWTIWIQSTDDAHAHKNFGNLWSSSILVIFPFGRLPFWSSSILVVFPFSHLPFWSSSMYTHIQTDGWNYSLLKLISVYAGKLEKALNNLIFKRTKSFVFARTGFHQTHMEETAYLGSSVGVLRRPVPSITGISPSLTTSVPKGLASLVYFTPPEMMEMILGSIVEAVVLMCSIDAIKVFAVITHTGVWYPSQGVCWTIL